MKDSIYIFYAGKMDRMSILVTPRTEMCVTTSIKNINTILHEISGLDAWGRKLKEIIDSDKAASNVIQLNGYPCA